MNLENFFHYPTRSVAYLSDHCKIYLKIAARFLETNQQPFGISVSPQQDPDDGQWKTVSYWQKTRQILNEIDAKERDSAFSVFIEAIVKYSFSFEKNHLLNFMFDLAGDIIDDQWRSIALIDYLSLAHDLRLLDVVRLQQTVQQIERVLVQRQDAGYTETQRYIYFELVAMLFKGNYLELVAELGSAEGVGRATLAVMALLSAMQQKENPKRQVLADLAIPLIAKVTPDLRKALFLASVGQFLISSDTAQAESLFEEALNIADTFEITGDYDHDVKKSSSSKPDFQRADDIVPTILAMCLESGYTGVLSHKAFVHLEQARDRSLSATKWKDRAKNDGLNSLDVTALLEPLRFLKIIAFLKSSEYQNVQTWLLDRLKEAIANRAPNQETPNPSDSDFTVDNNEDLEDITDDLGSGTNLDNLGDQFTFGDFGDFGNADANEDKTASQRISSLEALPYVVRDYYLRALVETSSPHEALKTIANETKSTSLATSLAEIWAERGDYKSALSAAMFVHIQNRTCWFSIAKIAIEQGELAAVEEAISHHRAVQAGAYLYGNVIAELLQRKDERVNSVSDHFLTHINRVSNPIVKVGLLTGEALITGVAATSEDIHALIRTISDDPETTEMFANAATIVSTSTAQNVYTQLERTLDYFHNVDVSRSKAKWKDFFETFDLDRQALSWILLVMPVPVALKWIQFVIQCYERQYREASDVGKLWSLRRIRLGSYALFRAIKHKSIHMFLVAYSVIGEYMGVTLDKFLYLDTSDHEFIKTANVLFVVAERFSENDIETLAWDVDEARRLTAEIENDPSSIDTLVIFASIFALLGKNDLAERLIQRLYIVEDKQEVVNALMGYAVILALLDNHERLLPVIDAAMALWDVRSEEQALRYLGGSYYATGDRLLHLPNTLEALLQKSSRETNDGQESEPAIIEIPVYPLAAVIASLLSHSHAREAIEILMRVSVPLRLSILGSLIEDYADNLDDNADQQQYFRQLASEQVKTLFDQAQSLRQKIFGATMQIISQNFAWVTDASATDKDRALLIKVLAEHNSMDVAKSLFAHIDHYTIVLSGGLSRFDVEGIQFSLEWGQNTDALPVAPSKEMPPVSEIDEPSPSAVLSLLKNDQVDLALQTARKIENDKERAITLRQIAHKLAQTRQSKATIVFEEAVRTARAAQSKSIPRPKSIIVKELVRSAILIHPDESLQLLLVLDTTHPDHQRDMLLLGGVMGFIEINHLADARVLAQRIQVESLKTDALVALIEAYSQAGQFEQIASLMQLAEGKMSKFRTLCAYGKALELAGDSGATLVLDQAQTISASFPQVRDRARSLCEYAVMLLRIKHLDGEAELQTAIETVQSISDMMTRYYLLLDLLEQLLTLNHPLADRLVSTIKEIITESVGGEVYQPILDVAPALRIQLRESAQNLYNTAALNTPIWEITALLELGRLLIRHQRDEVARSVLEEARITARSAHWLRWDVTQDFTSVTQIDKRFFERADFSSLVTVLEEFSALEDSFRKRDSTLPRRVKTDLLRLFKWVEYTPGDINYLVGTVQRMTSSN